jgi:hypothetical protein
MIFNRNIYTMGLCSLFFSIYAHEPTEAEIRKKYQQEIKRFEQKVKETLEKERNITQQALNNTKSRQQQVNRVLNNLRKGQTEREFKEYTIGSYELKDLYNKQDQLSNLIAQEEQIKKEISQGRKYSPSTKIKERQLNRMKQDIDNLNKEIGQLRQQEQLDTVFMNLRSDEEVLKSDEKSIQNNLDKIQKKLTNIPGYIKSLQHKILRQDDMPITDLTNEYEKGIASYAERAAEPLSSDEQLMTRRYRGYRVSYLPWTNEEFDNMVMHNLADVDAKILNVPHIKEVVYSQKRELANIIGVPSGYRGPLYSAAEPTMFAKIKNWFSSFFTPRPSVAMQFTPSTPRRTHEIGQLTTPQTVRNRVQKWTSKKKEQVKGWAEKKAGSRLEGMREERQYLPAGWTFDPWHQ